MDHLRIRIHDVREERGDEGGQHTTIRIYVVHYFEQDILQFRFPQQRGSIWRGGGIVAAVGIVLV
jgi:hypothetical protein